MPADSRHPSIWIKQVIPNSHEWGEKHLRWLLKTAPRPVIWETNMETDPATGDTAVVLQYREADAHAFRFDARGCR